MKLKKFIEFIEMCIGIIVISFGINLMIKSNLGQTAYIALVDNISKIVDVKVGTCVIIFNISCILGQMVLLRQDFKKIQLMQVITAYLNGQIVNVFCYDFLPTANIIPNNYLIQWLLILCGILIVSFGIAITRNADSIKMPLEELAFVLSNKINHPLPKVRQSIDLLLIVGSLLLILLFKLDFSTLREGTWFSMLVLGRSMAYTFPMTKYILDNINRKVFKMSISY